MTISEGITAPPFSLEDTNGDIVSLADFAGRHLVIYFYPRDDTPGCTKEACGFRDLWEEFKQHDISVLGVSPDNATTHQKFTTKYKLPFPLLCDPEKKMMKDYAAYGEKVLYGVKSIGIIRSTVWINRTGKIQKHWKRVSKAEQHPAHVLAALQKLKE